jgi:hypothetical protein
MDALSFHAAGIPAVSIPAGGIEEGEREDTARLRWMAAHDALLAGAKRIYLALDADQVGGSTAKELARRLGKGAAGRSSTRRAARTPTTSCAGTGPRRSRSSC